LFLKKLTDSKVVTEKKENMDEMWNKHGQLSPLPGFALLLLSPSMVAESTEPIMAHKI
jgi:hypothetical protein